MSNFRIIPRLDIKGPNLVKGIHLEGLRVLGKPKDFARYYYENGADELYYQDVVASLYERNSLNEIITETAKEAFIPLTVGGGLRTIEDIKKVLSAGADKVALNTAAIRNPDFISEAAKIFGSSTIVVAIEAIKNSDGQYYAFVDNGREQTGIEVFEWAKKAEELGAGEIVITSVDNEGTGLGYDLELIKGVTENVSIQVIAHGGGGKKEDILELTNGCDVSAVAVSSILHYDFIKHNFSMKDSVEGNVEFIKKRRSFDTINEEGLPQIKQFLFDNGVECRL